MRSKGTLTTWNDERGFGFLKPSQGGEEIFVHARAFRVRDGRPQVGQVMFFDVEFMPQGKRRANNVELIRPPHTRKSRLRKFLAQRGTATLLVIPVFLVLYVIVSVLWEPPLIFAAAYAVISFITFIAYSRDKSAAQQNARRTPEKTLHFLALVGGWPGALLAQQLLRHKSTKAEFRSVFWGTVLLNGAAFVILCSPTVQSLWAALTL
jgi:uncharacterized membrane protein YsdA (DUF1294 family)/cold shock CspA family protein